VQSLTNTNFSLYFSNVLVDTLLFLSVSVLPGLHFHCQPPATHCSCLYSCRDMSEFCNACTHSKYLLAYIHTYMHTHTQTPVISVYTHTHTYLRHHLNQVAVHHRILIMQHHIFRLSPSFPPSRLTLLLFFILAPPLPRPLRTRCLLLRCCCCRRRCILFLCPACYMYKSRDATFCLSFNVCVWGCCCQNFSKVSIIDN
jgi:hypothetical protein